MRKSFTLFTSLLLVCALSASIIQASEEASDMSTSTAASDYSEKTVLYEDPLNVLSDDSCFETSADTAVDIADCNVENEARSEEPDSHIDNEDLSEETVSLIDVTNELDTSSPETTVSASSAAEASADEAETSITAYEAIEQSSEETTQDADYDSDDNFTITDVQVTARSAICHGTHCNTDGAVYKYTDYNYIDESTGLYNLEYTVSYTQNGEDLIFTGNSEDLFRLFGEYPSLTYLGTVKNTGKLIVCEILSDIEYSFIIFITDHSVVIDPAVEATYTSTGLTEGSHCSICGTILTKQEEIPPISPVPTEDGWYYIENNWYYYQNGVAATGWLYDTDENNWFYLNNEGIMQTGWQCIGNSWYYMSAGGRMRTGWQYIDNNWYYFGTNGKMWYGGWVYIDTDWYYLGAGGKMWYGGWVYTNNNWYYLTNGGQMMTDWQYINGSWYYLGSNGKMWYGGWMYIDNEWYFLSESGKVQTGWQYLYDNWYYMGAGGKMKTGWQYINEYWYYLDSSGKMYTGWHFIDTDWYYFGSGGKMWRNGWMYIDNNWYCLTDGGRAKVGWQLINDKWYYFDTAGIMLTGHQLINGKVYMLDSSGKYISSSDREYTTYTGFLFDGTDWLYVEKNSLMNITNVSKGTVNGKTAWYYVENGKVCLTKNGTFTFGIRNYTIENGIATDCNYYFIDDAIELPSGGYDLVKDMMGLKVLKVNEKLLGISAWDSTSYYYTDDTVSAVKNFQRSNSLSATGVVDILTWKAMGFSEYDWYNLGSYVTPLKSSTSFSINDYRAALLQTAREYIDADTDYAAGASGNPGSYVDCSGLVFQCLYSVGINPSINIIEHATVEFASKVLAFDNKLGKEISRSELQAGDLIFYVPDGLDDDDVHHVAVYAGNGQIYDSDPWVGVRSASIDMEWYHIYKIVRLF